MRRALSVMSHRTIKYPVPLFVPWLLSLCPISGPLGKIPLRPNLFLNFAVKKGFFNLHVTVTRWLPTIIPIIWSLEGGLHVQNWGRSQSWSRFHDSGGI